MKTVLLIIVVLVIGGFVGVRLERKLVQKEINTTAANTPAQVNKAQRGSGQQEHTVNFLLPESKEILEPSDEDIANLEKEMKTKTLSVSIKLHKKTPGKIPFKVQLGMLNSTRVVDFLKKGNPVIPTYSASPVDNQDCSAETQFITLSKNKITTVSELAGKNLGVTVPALPIVPIPLMELKKHNSKINNLYVIQTVAEGILALNTGKIDAVALRVAVLSNNEVLSKLGTISQDTYTDFQDIKIISTTKTNIPCNVIFISSKIPLKRQEDLSNKLMDISSRPESKIILKNVLGVTHLIKITPERWKKIEEKINSVGAFQLENIANKVFRPSGN